MACSLAIHYLRGGHEWRWMDHAQGRQSGSLFPGWDSWWWGRVGWFRLQPSFDGVGDVDTQAHTVRWYISYLQLGCTAFKESPTLTSPLSADDPGGECGSFQPCNNGASVKPMGCHLQTRELPPWLPLLLLLGGLCHLRGSGHSQVL